MIRDITIGQFYPVDSSIHRLDARTKLFMTFIFIITLFMINSFFGYCFVILSLTGVIILSKVPFKFMLKGIKSIVFILVFTAFINVFMTKGEIIYWSYGFLSISHEGVITGIKMCSRLFLLIIGSSLLTLTTTPIKLTDAIESILAPFKKIGVPAHEIAMMMTIALRFIPTLLDETDKIMKAQQARGADFESGNLIKKAKSLIPILVPLFISAFRRAEELAMAMEARCYRGDQGRTKMYKMKFTGADLIAFTIAIFYTSVIIGLSLTDSIMNLI